MSNSSHNVSKTIKFYTYSILRWVVHRLPPGIRSLAGIALMIGGIFGILPILGFWMFPLGLAFIALDIPWTKGRIFEWMTRLEKDLKAGPEKNRIS